LFAAGADAGASGGEGAGVGGGLAGRLPGAGAVPLRRPLAAGGVLLALVRVRPAAGAAPPGAGAGAVEPGVYGPPRRGAVGVPAGEGADGRGAGVAVDRGRRGGGGVRSPPARRAVG